jgi:hypothetical protein
MSVTDSINTVRAEDLGLSEAEVRQVYPWATEYTDASGRPYWLRHELGGDPGERGDRP